MPTEAPNTLRSRAKFKIVDIISQGPIKGIVNGAKSIYLDDTPIQAEDGTSNFPNIEPDKSFKELPVYTGGLRRFMPVAVFPSSENEVSVATKVTRDSPEGSGSGDGSVTRTITNANLDYIRVTMRVPALTNTNTTTGDITGGTIKFKIEVQPSGGVYAPITSGSRWTPLGTPSSETTNGATGIEFTALVSGNKTKPQGFAFQYRKKTGGTWGAWTTYHTVTIPATSPSTSNRGFNNQYWYYNQPYTKAVTGLTPGIYQAQCVALNMFTSTSPSAAREYVGSYIEIQGKTVSAYDASYLVPLPEGGAPWNVRVTRLSDDTTAANIQDDLYWFSYTEMIDNRFEWPNIAGVQITIDAESFGGNVPNRSYDVMGLMVQIPSNYDPYERTYTGVWNGTFKTDWTDNPAWIFYDLLTNKRYGLGDNIDASQIDKYALYQIAQYCDELVDAPNGEQEPRYTCSCVINSQSEAYELLTAIASAFRGMIYHSGGMITPVADMPSDPVLNVGPANVIDGIFTYQGASRKARHTVARVSWNNPDDGYKLNVELYEDTEAIRKYGYRPIDINAFGCTSRGLARRWGKWAIVSDNDAPDTVTYKAGFDHFNLRPGDVINIADPNYSGEQLFGLIVSVTDNVSPATHTIKLDRAVTRVAGDTSELQLTLADGSILALDVAVLANTTSDEITVDSAELTTIPLAGASWLLKKGTVEPRQWRVISISEDEPHIYQVTAMLYDPNKYDSIETGLNFAEADFTAFPSGPLAAPTGLAISEFLKQTGSAILECATFSWVRPADARAELFEVQYQEDGKDWQATTPNLTGVTSVDIINIVPGTYNFRVRTQDSSGIFRSEWATLASQTLQGKNKAPENVTGFTASVEKFGVLLSWNKVSDIDIDYYEIRTGASWAAGTPIAKVKATTFKYEDATTGAYTFWIKALDTQTPANESATAASTSVTVSAQATPSVVATAVNGGIQLTISGTTSRGFKAYEIQRKEYPSGTETTINSNVLTKIFTDTNIATLTYTKSWQYRVRALDQNGSASAWSSLTSATTPKQIENNDITANQIIAKDFRTACNAGNGTVSGVLFNANGIQAWNGATNTFCINAATGDVSMTGTITALAGNIGGFCADPTEGLHAGCTTTRVQMKPGAGFWAGATAIGDAPFSVTQAGVLKSTSGTIGGFSIGTNILCSTPAAGCSVGMSACNTSGAVAFWAGCSTIASAPFRVTNTGAITACSGTIGGWALASASLSSINAYLYSGAANTARLEMGTGATAAGVNSANAGTDISFWAGSTHANRDTAPFRVTAAGALTATSGTIGGWDLTASKICKSKIMLGANSDGFGVGLTLVGPGVGYYAVQINNSCLYDTAYRCRSGILIRDIATGGVIFRADACAIDGTGQCMQLAGWNFNTSQLYSTGCGLILCNTGAIQTGDFVTSNKGWKIDSVGNAEFNNICARGAIRTAVFIKDQISVVGGCTMIRPASVLSADDVYSASSNIYYVDDNTQFAVNDLIRIKSDAGDFWGKVTASATGCITVGYCNGNTSGNITKGQAIVNYGSCLGCGGIMLNGQCPYIDLYTHAGDPWNALCSRVRIGNLKNWSANFACDTYGIAMGSALGQYMTYDSVSGVLDIAGNINVKSTLPLVMPAGAVGEWVAKGSTTASIAVAGGVIDISGNANHGSIYNSVTVVDTEIGKAFDFDGVSDYISTPVRLFSGTNSANPASLSLFIKHDSTQAATAGDSVIFGQAYFAGFGLSVFNGRLRAFFRNSASSWASSNIGVQDAWQHIALVWGGQSNPKVYVYLNGALIQSLTITYANFAYNLDLYPLRIASAYAGGGNAWTTLKGQVAHPKAFNRALTAEEVKTLYLLGKDTESGTITAERIKTGVMSSLNWGASAGSCFNMNDGKFTLGGSSAPKLSWNGTTLNVVGNITIAAGSSGIANLSDAGSLATKNNITMSYVTDAGALATVNNLDGVGDGSTYKKTTANEKTGAGRAYSGLDSSNRLITAVIPGTAVTPSTAGLFIGSTNMGYHNGTDWKTYMSNTGNFYLSGTGANGLSWNGTTLSIAGNITITGGSGIGNFSDAGALATVDNLDGVADGTTYKRTTQNEKTGAGRAYSGLDAGNRLITAVIPGTTLAPTTAGLFIGSNNMGYHNGTEWRTYMGSNGNFYLGGTGANNGLAWDAANNCLTVCGCITSCAGTIGGWSVSAGCLTTYGGTQNQLVLLSSNPANCPYFLINACVPTGATVHSLGGRLFNGAWLNDRWGMVLRVGGNNLFQVHSCIDGTTCFCAQIAGWNFNAACLYSGNLILNSSGAIQGNYSGDISGWCIDAAGNAKFNNATVRGVICACGGGNIGGFTIGTSMLCSTPAAGCSVGMSACTTSGAIAFWAGCSTVASAPFRVTNTGALTACSGNIGQLCIDSCGLGYYVYIPGVNRTIMNLDLTRLYLEHHSTTYAGSILALCSLCSGTDASCAPITVYMNGATTCFAFCTNGRIQVQGTVYPSDRNIKTDFQDINVLHKLRQLPITLWRFKDSKDYQIGPVAQDFNSIFRLSHDWQTNLTVSGLDGIALKAVKEVDENVQRLEKDNAKIREKLQKLECEMAALREMIN